MLKEFKKSDLKNGMVVETRNGHLYFVFNERLIRKYVWDRLTNWNEDLSSKNNLIEYDIIRVFNMDFNKFYCLNDLLKKDNLKLLWEEENEGSSDIQNKFKNITDEELLEEVKRRFK